MNPNDKEAIKKMKKKWPRKTFQGFFRANRTDKALVRMKNPFRVNNSFRPVAEVLEASKNHHLALYRLVPPLHNQTSASLYDQHQERNRL